MLPSSAVTYIFVRILLQKMFYDGFIYTNMYEIVFASLHALSVSK